MSHSQEPWSARDYGIYSADGKCVFDEGDWKLTDGDRARVLACVNACRGIPTEALTPDSVLKSITQLGDQMRQGVHINGKYVAHIVIEAGNLMGDFERVVKDLRTRLPDIYGKTGEIHVGMSFQEKPCVNQRIAGICPSCGLEATGGYEPTCPQCGSPMMPSAQRPTEPAENV
jgi:hypothetical protein